MLQNPSREAAAGKSVGRPNSHIRMVEAAGKSTGRPTIRGRTVEAADRMQQARVQVDYKVTVGWWRQEA